ncbi:MAG: orotidine-5'-phosphate decarboxylase [Xanthobacteraceae bacterium]|nr:orotidine-5'-phosphate decarboxylase [Xanthobacteraceae bacterium]QYK45029.1 MAG: orotidine-5'-phosphate decarboxylase [Xanthobacteraceae bacterium]HMN52271.1 orotidine-5'-phosphate decarboxylase [Xanthobacteraceae bacterium]
MSANVSARDRVIVALDVPDVAEAEKAVWALGDSASFYKIGYELVMAGGLSLAEDLVQGGKKVFLDMKLHDIGNTVMRATERAAQLGVTFLTVHAFPQTMRAAVEGRGNSGLKVLAVTVLTSWDDNDLNDAGYSATVPELVARRAAQASAIGIDGLVCSPAEAADIRRKVGEKMLLVTPGIRPAGSAKGDQKRIMTPSDAIKAGADYMVIGRPILAAEDPKAAAETIVAEIEQTKK